MNDDYPLIAGRIRLSEGGYTNNRKDPGGPTNYGVTICDGRLYGAKYGWISNPTAADIQAMPTSFADKVLKTEYWDALDCDALMAGLDYTVDDYGVNSGIGRSGKVLRRCLGLSQADWHVTPDVIAALAKRDIKALINEINDERLNFLEHLSTWPEFGKGWGQRVASVRAISLHLFAGGSAAAAPAAHVATPDMPSAKAAASAPDLFTHLADAADWQGTWNKISAFLEAPL